MNFICYGNPKVIARYPENSVIQQFSGHRGGQIYIKFSCPTIFRPQRCWV